MFFLHLATPEFPDLVHVESRGWSRVWLLAATVAIWKLSHSHITNTRGGHLSQALLLTVLAREVFSRKERFLQQGPKNLPAEVVLHVHILPTLVDTVKSNVIQTNAANPSHTPILVANSERIRALALWSVQGNSLLHAANISCQGWLCGLPYPQSQSRFLYNKILEKVGS